MKNSKLVIGIILAIAVILLAVGFAVISTVNLQISGSGSATASQANFKVKFTGSPTVSNSNRCTATITGDLTGTIAITGLTTKGDYVTAEYTVANQSTDLKAELTSSVTNSNTDWFKVTSTLADEEIAAGETTTLTVKVELLNTPADDENLATIGVEVAADPEVADDTSGGNTTEEQSIKATEIDEVWYTNFAQTSTFNYVDGSKGWALRQDDYANAYNKPINRISFVSNATSGTFNLCTSKYQSQSEFSNIQNITWDSSKKVGNIVTIDIDEITLSSDDYLCIFVQSAANNTACYANGSTAGRFYSYVGQSSNKAWSTNNLYSIQINLGYKVRIN